MHTSHSLSLSLLSHQKHVKYREYLLFFYTLPIEYLKPKETLNCLLLLYSNENENKNNNYEYLKIKIFLYFSVIVIVVVVAVAVSVVAIAVNL